MPSTAPRGNATQMPTTISTRVRTASIPILVLLITACGSPGPTGATAPQPATSSGAPAVASPEPAVSVPDPSPVVPDPSTEPTVTPQPTATAVHVPTTWSSSSRIFGDGCSGPSATIDASGRFHVVVGCGMNVRYATSSDGRSWKTTLFRHPAHRFDVEPQIAVDGSTLYVAFTRLRPTDGGCGDDGLVDVGVFLRTRQLPSGPWSAPVRIGQVGDHLQSFRVSDGAVHETVVTRDGVGPIVYRKQAGGSTRSTRLPGAVETSLRIGDDGRARIAYSTGRTLRFATVDADGRVAARRIFDGRNLTVSRPILVLGAGNHAYMTFTADRPYGGGCAEPDFEDSRIGTYFATDSNGTWNVKRLTRVPAETSLVVDVSTGRVDAILGGARALRGFVRTPAGNWTNAPVPRTADMSSPVVRRDPSNGTLLLVAVFFAGEHTAVVAMTER